MPIPVALRGLPILTLFLTLVPAALAGHTWYVDGVNGNDNNNCQSRQHACKTITNAMFVSLPGDSIFVAPATYHESLNGIPFPLKIIGSGAKTTIVGAAGLQSQVVIIGSEPKAQVTLSGMTFRNGGAQVDGGGICNCFGTLTVIDSIITNNKISGSGVLGYGGAIYNCPFSPLTLINTTISDNTAEVGGAICNGGVRFSGEADGAKPIAGVVRDAAGNLYGTTQFGGDLTCGPQGGGCGVVFKLDVHGKETVLHGFTGEEDGALPYGLLTLDDVGNLYGTTLNGGDLSQQCADIDHPGCGVVFRIDKNGHLTILHTFKSGADGANPTAGVIRDAAGNLYGATQGGGDSNCQFGGGCGVVFKIAP